MDNEIRIEIPTDAPEKFIGTPFISNEKQVGIIAKIIKRDGNRTIFKVELDPIE